MKNRSAGAEDTVVLSPIHPVQPAGMNRGQVDPRFKYVAPWKGIASRIFVFLTRRRWCKEE